MRDTIIFSGQSNTFGLGLEWELDPELNSEEYLTKGIKLPIPRKDYYETEYWQKYRWTGLVCKELNYKEYNVHDIENRAIMGGAAAHTLWHILDRYEQLKHILDKTKYVILEIGYIRWWDETLHGQDGGEKLPNTPIEIENYLNLKNPNKEVFEKAIKWIEEYDQEYFWKETFNKLIKFTNNFPNIQVILIPWSGTQNDFLSYDELNNTVKGYFLDINGYPSIRGFLQIEKLHICDKAKAFNGNYKYNYREDHASIEGHRRIANMVINHIKKLENDTKR